MCPSETVTDLRAASRLVGAATENQTLRRVFTGKSAYGFLTQRSSNNGANGAFEVVMLLSVTSGSGHFLTGAVGGPGQNFGDETSQRHNETKLFLHSERNVIVELD